MKRIMALVIALFLLCGCGEEQQTKGFYCTQERVCRPLSCSADYDLLRCGTDRSLVIPGLRQNFVPQGIAYWKERDWILLSGYFMPYTDGLSSALLAVNRSTGKMVGEYSLADEKGKACTGHFSGVAVNRDYLYVTGTDFLYQVELNEFKRVGSTGALRVQREIPVALLPGTCGFANGILWVCEYYEPTHHPLSKDHKVRFKDGQTQHAWLIGYEIDDGLKPRFVFSVPDRIQGITALKDGRIVMSQSYGRKNRSSLLVFNDPRKTREPDTYVQLKGESIPMWHLDNEQLTHRLSMPPMAEGCCVLDDEVLLIFESCAYYYRAMTPEYTALDPTDRIWSVHIP